MQSVSSLYESIRDSLDYYVETNLIVCDNAIPISSDYIDDTHKELNQEYTYDEEQILDLSTNRNVFTHNQPEVGCCTCGEIDVSMFKPNIRIPPMARLTPYVRLVSKKGYDNLLIDVAPKTVTLTGDNAYTGYYYFVNGYKFSKGDYITIEYDYSVNGITTTNAQIYSQLNASAVSPIDSFKVTNNTSGHHVAIFCVTEAQANYTSSTRIRMRLRYANVGASFTISNVKMYYSPSEWLRKGVFFIDTRNVTKNDDRLDILTLHGYDSMMKANANYSSSSNLSVPDITAVREIASVIGVEVDPRTVEIISKNYTVLSPTSYTMIEVLGQIASAYGGNFIINDIGKLQLIPLWNLPPESNLLTDENYFPITFGRLPDINEPTRIDLGDEE